MTTNVFADYGSVVSGARFLGRSEELRRLRTRLLAEGAYASIALVGMPRVGKTSLVEEFVRTSPACVGTSPLVVVRVEVGTVSSVSELFAEIGTDLKEQLERLRLWDESLQEGWRQVKDAADDDAFRRLRRLLKLVKKTNARVICVMDEFDSVRRLFSSAPQRFHWIRELAATPRISHWPPSWSPRDHWRTLQRRLTNVRTTGRTFYSP